MQREEAEKLLAALIFDDLDETSKTELLDYLQNDNELRERLADAVVGVVIGQRGAVEAVVVVAEIAAGGIGVADAGGVGVDHRLAEE